MRRETRWLDVESSFTTLATNNVPALINSLSAVELALRPFTFVRVRGVAWIVSDQALATETYSVALGAAVVSDQALGIGVTAVPTPITDQASDLWFMYEQFMGGILLATAIGFEEPNGSFFKYDSKAMRKVDDGQDVAFVVETDDAGITAGVQIKHGGRALIKLH